MNNQKGAALFVSLIILLMLTVLGISSMQSTIVQEKMAGNSNDYNVALQAAEVALREGENWIWTLTGKPVASSTPTSAQVWVLDSPADTTKNTMWWTHRDDDWWTTNSVQITDSLSRVDSKPRYLNEELSFVKDSLNVGMPGDNSGRSLFRTTAKGTGGNAETRVLLQSTYSRRF